MRGFVEVVVKATKQKQLIPAHWLEHPELAEPFTKTPSTKAAEAKAARAATTTDAAPAANDKE